MQRRKSPMTTFMGAAILTNVRAVIGRNRSCDRQPNNTCLLVGPNVPRSSAIKSHLFVKKLQETTWRTFCMLCVRLFEIIWSQNILVPLVSERNETKRGLATRPKLFQSHGKNIFRCRPFDYMYVYSTNVTVPEMVTLLLPTTIFMDTR